MYRSSSEKDRFFEAFLTILYVLMGSAKFLPLLNSLCISPLKIIHSYTILPERFNLKFNLEINLLV